MASAQRTPRTYPSRQTPSISVCRAAPAIRSRTSEISKSPYLNSEDLLEEIKLKKMKLHCKDEMERLPRVSCARVPVTANNDFIAGDSVVE